MRTKKWGFLTVLLAATSALGLALLQEARASTAPAVRIGAVVEADAVRFEATAEAPFDFITRQPGANLFLVDLEGVAPDAGDIARLLPSGLVSSYRVLQHRIGNKLVVRLEILLHPGAVPRVERESPSKLRVVVERTANRMVPTPASASSERVAPLREIGSITIEPGSGEVVVRIVGNGRLAYGVERLSNPDRVVLDFSGTMLRAPARRTTGVVAPVKAVRSSQFTADRARVVIDLYRLVPYSVDSDETCVRVAFRMAADSRVPAEVGGRDGRESAPGPPEMGLGRMSLPESLASGAGIFAHPAAAQVGIVSSSEPKAHTEPVGEPKGPSQPQQPAVPQRPAMQYTEEPVSVDLKDVDLKDFFRLIHEISGLNIVLDPNVKGSVTLDLDDVPWDQALDIVLRNNHLEKQLEGNVLRIATRETLKKEAEMLKDLAKAQAEAVPLVTATRVLSYAKATVLRDTLKKFLTSRGQILADERSNMLIISDIPAVLPELDNLIRQLDRKAQQVEIEARVVAATRAFERDIGTQLGIAAGTRNRRNLFGGLSRFPSELSRGLTPPPPLFVADSEGNIPLNTNLGAQAPTSGYSFFHTSPNLALDFIITAAERKGVGKLLSKPKLITQNNEKGVVKQGTKIPVQTIINNTISVQFVEAVLKLEVTPQITAEGTIFMDVVVENTAIDEGIPRVNNIPALSTQAVESKVTVGDGETYVVGGVIVSNQRTDVNQVPFIGSIPLIGHLFKRTTITTQSQELLFFLTPRIVAE